MQQQPASGANAAMISYSVMRVGVFTALLAQMPLDDVLKEAERRTAFLPSSSGPAIIPAIRTANFPCSRTPAELDTFQKDKLADHGVTISALSCHGNPLHPDQAIAKGFADTNQKTILLAEKLGRSRSDRFFRLPWR